MPGPCTVVIEGMKLVVGGTPGPCVGMLHLGWVYDAKSLPSGISEISGASDLDQDKIDVILSW